MRKLERALLPAIVFAGIWALHYVFVAVFSEGFGFSPDQWVTVGKSSAWSRYLSAQTYFLSYTYALSFSFAVIQLRRYRENKACPTGRVAVIGSLGITGVLNAGGCFLLGCCGSPMLGVYLSLFGARFVPAAKPIIAGVSTAILLGAGYWIERRNRRLKDGFLLSSPGCRKI